MPYYYTSLKFEMKRLSSLMSQGSIPIFSQGNSEDLQNKYEIYVCILIAQCVVPPSFMNRN